MLISILTLGDLVDLDARVALRLETVPTGGFAFLTGASRWMSDIGRVALDALLLLLGTFNFALVRRDWPYVLPIAFRRAQKPADATSRRSSVLSRLVYRLPTLETSLFLGYAH